METLLQNPWLNSCLYALAYVICLNQMLQAPVKSKIVRFGAFFCCVLLSAHFILKPTLLGHFLFAFALILVITALFQQRLYQSCSFMVWAYLIVGFSSVVTHIIGYSFRPETELIRVLTWPRYADQSAVLLILVTILNIVYQSWNNYFRNRSQEIRRRSGVLAGINLLFLFLILVLSNVYLRFLTVYSAPMFKIPVLMPLLVGGYLGMMILMFGMLFFINLSIISHRHLNEVKEYAVKDIQTGVLNRQAGLDVLAQRIRESRQKEKPLSICFVDINNLKQVNDKLGHAVGDNLIEVVSETIRSSLRDLDFVCRLGGDEFLITFYGCNLAQARTAWSRIFTLLNRLNENPAINFPVSVSYGFAEYNPVENLSVKDFIEQADAEMYVNKNKYKKIKSMNRTGTLESKDGLGIE